MVRIKVKDISLIAKRHFDAVKSRVMTETDEQQNRLKSQVCQIDGIEDSPSDEWSWLEQLILANHSTIAKWVRQCPEKLNIEYFKTVYSSYFSNGSSVFLDEGKTYNAYKYLDLMDLKVCPYCENEYITQTAAEKESRRRSSEIDHFYPKSKYPALAMSFYNLIPSGKVCNSFKMEHLLGASPYEKDIEQKTHFSLDVPIGINLETVKETDCRINLNAQKGMCCNADVLKLNDIYAVHTSEALELLRSKQSFPPEKIEEMVRLGFYKDFEEGIRKTFNLPLPQDEGKTLNRKMIKDLTGY